LRERVKRTWGLDFNVRIGINTGMLVVGDFGSRDWFEYTAMGDAINLAAKIQQAGDPAPCTSRRPPTG
jgi:class 3 adenylate cyclase